MIMKKNAIIAKVRMPLTHQFFHLEDKLERALLRTSGVSSAEGGWVTASTLLSLSDAVSPSAFASDSDSLSSGGASGSRATLCLSSVMLETPALSSRCRVAQTPGPARGLCSASPELPKQSAATQRLACPTAAQPPALELGPARLSRRPFTRAELDQPSPASACWLLF